MAFKFTVDHTDLRIIIDTDSLEPVTSFQNIKTDLSFVGLEQDLTFVNLTAANVFLDADSKDLFFTSGHPNAIIISLTDTPVVSFSKAASDTTSVSEEAVLTVGKGLSDTPTISESLARVVTYIRAFTDTPTVSESAALAFSTSQADSATVSESSVLSFSSAQADSATVSESPALSFSTAQAETATISDAPALGFETGQSDSSTLSESEVKAIGKAVDDSTASDQTFTVTVVSTGSGNKYFIDGTQQATVQLKVGATYTFDQADSSNSGHPLRFSTTSNGSHGGGSEYTTNVTTNGTPGSAGAYTRIQVTGSTPSVLYYYCTNHSAMGGAANISAAGDFSVTEALVFSYATVLADAYTLDDTASASDDLRTDINIVKGNVLTVDDGTFGVNGTQVVVTTQPFPSDTSSISESAALAFATAFADSVTMSDTPFINPGQVVTDTPNLSEAIQSLTFSKSLSDSATISESLSILFVSGASSVLNTAALNTSVLN